MAVSSTVSSTGQDEFEGEVVPVHLSPQKRTSLWDLGGGGSYRSMSSFGVVAQLHSRVVEILRRTYAFVGPVLATLDSPSRKLWMGFTC